MSEDLPENSDELIFRRGISDDFLNNPRIRKALDALRALTGTNARPYPFQGSHGSFDYFDPDLKKLEFFPKNRLIEPQRELRSDAGVASFAPSEKPVRSRGQSVRKKVFRALRKQGKPIR